MRCILTENTKWEITFKFFRQSHFPKILSNGNFRPRVFANGYDGGGIFMGAGK